MPIAITKRPKFAAFLAVWFAFSLLIFLSYRATMNAHEWIITPVALKAELSIPDSWFAAFEVRRRVNNGSLRNAEFLSYVLSLATVDGIDNDKVVALADQILDNGLDVDSVDISKTPLQEAINVNNRGAVEYLLSRCADPFAVANIGSDEYSQQMNAFELLDILREVDPDTDRGGIARVMEQWKPISGCNDR